MRRPPLIRGDDGTSLVELMIVVTVLLVIIGSALQIFDSGTRTERAQQARHDALLDVRQALDRIAKDTRQATLIDPASTRNRLAVETTIDGVAHDIVFELVAGEIRRIVDGGAPVPLADHVTSTDPFCYDPPEPCEAASPSDPTMISVKLAVEPEVFSGGPIELKTDIQLRNA